MPGRPYSHLKIADRRKIYVLSGQKKSASDIAAHIGRHRSTVYREIRRNTHLHEDPDYRGYFPLTAQELAQRRRHRRSKLERDRRLKGFVEDRLREYWSPEQIAGYLRRQETAFYVCHEAIYQYVYSLEGREKGLYQNLFRRRFKRLRRFGRKRRERIPEEHSIHYRPAAINDRSAFGHWEADLLAFQREHGLANITSLIERKSRYTLLVKNATKETKPVMSGIVEHLKALPPASRQSITFDRGHEFMSYHMLDYAYGMRSYFCDPRSPWQKGTVENNNGRLRRFLPANTKLADVPEEDISALCHRMNNTPRKCLNYRTPQEAFREHLQQQPENLNYDHNLLHFR
jgi:IS30 family transposase